MLVEGESPVSHSNHFTAWEESYMYVSVRKQFGPHGRSRFHAKFNIIIHIYIYVCIYISII